MSARAQAPAMAPPDFPAPKIFQGHRSAGHVQVPDPSTENAGPLEMSWKLASAGALEEPHPPTKLRRTSSVAGNVLVVETDNGRTAYWLQRKITEESHTHNYVRIGFPLQPLEYEGSPMNSAWTVTKAQEGSMYPFEMVAIKVQNTSNVFPEESSYGGGDGGLLDGSEHSASSSSNNNKSTRMRNAKNEISALQMIAAITSSEFQGNVLRAEVVCNDDIQVYIAMPYCKEGTLLDLIGTIDEEAQKLGETDARKYFGHILNGLETLQKAKLCHRNLSLETVLMRGDECQLASLGLALRVPVGDDGNTVHLIEPQETCGRKPQYIAPEVFRNDPFDGYAVDLWSAGVMLFLMLFGLETFISAPIPEDPKFQEICVNGRLKNAVEKMQALTPNQKPVSEEAIDLLQNMLRADPADRFTLSQIKNHAWTKGEQTTTT